MVRINIVVEGQTEERFVKKVLTPYLSERRVYSFASSVGGISTYGKARRDIENWLKQDTSAYCSTMFDLYGLPKDFPGYQKVLFGEFVAKEISVDGIRAKCPHFDEWVSKLEQLKPH